MISSFNPIWLLIPLAIAVLAIWLWRRKGR
jgi:hypothetical protein